VSIFGLFVLLNDNKSNSGVYLIIYEINKNNYVSSSYNLGKRLGNNTIINYINNYTLNSILYKFKKKYDLENFSIIILEFYNKNFIWLTDKLYYQNVETRIENNFNSIYHFQ
jgi:hypothetical protein